MTPTTLPAITSQAALSETWETLLAPHGYGRRTLWLFVVDPDDRPVPPITQIDDVPLHPRPHEQGALARFVGHLLQPGARIAFLLSRPGMDGLSPGDRRWAATLYAACRQAGVPCETVHRANDLGLLPVTLDDLPA